HASAYAPRPATRYSRRGVQWWPCRHGSSLRGVLRQRTNGNAGSSAGDADEKLVSPFSWSDPCPFRMPVSETGSRSNTGPGSTAKWGRRGLSERCGPHSGDVERNSREHGKIRNGG